MRALTLTFGVLLLNGCSPPEQSFSLGEDSRAVLDSVLSSAVRAKGVPGVVALVTASDGVLYRGAAGYWDEEGTEPMRTDAIFNIASMTKPITSLGIMMLAEEGLLAIDDPASEYLPDLLGREVLVEVRSTDSSVVTRPASREVTIRDLLRHTSGFGYSFCSPQTLALSRATSIPSREYPLLHEPGERWTYGMSTAFLGWIIEEVTGLPLAEFIDSRIATPLGMVDTSPDLSPQNHVRLAAVYSRVDGQLRGEPRPDEYQASFRGDGGLLSTVDDYARFIQLILGGGEREGVRLVSQGSVAEMARDQLDGLVVTEQPGVLPNWSHPFPLGAGKDGFGLGFQISAEGTRGGRAPGSLSWAGIQNTHFWIDGESGLGVVLMMQLLPFYDPQAIDLLTSFEQAVYDELGIGEN